MPWKSKSQQRWEFPLSQHNRTRWPFLRKAQWSVKQKAIQTVCSCAVAHFVCKTGPNRNWFAWERSQSRNGCSLHWIVRTKTFFKSHQVQFRKAFRILHITKSCWCKRKLRNASATAEFQSTRKSDSCHIPISNCDTIKHADALSSITNSFQSRRWGPWFSFEKLCAKACRREDAQVVDHNFANANTNASGTFAITETAHEF